MELAMKIMILIAPKTGNFEIIGKLDWSFFSRYGRTWVKVNGQSDVRSLEVAPGTQLL
jgi:hypothetical protein